MTEKQQDKSNSNIILLPILFALWVIVGFVIGATYVLITTDNQMNSDCVPFASEGNYNFNLLNVSRCERNEWTSMCWSYDTEVIQTNKSYIKLSYSQNMNLLLVSDNKPEVLFFHAVNCIEDCPEWRDVSPEEMANKTLWHPPNETNTTSNYTEVVMWWA